MRYDWYAGFLYSADFNVEKETMFHIDVKAQSKKGTLKISEINKKGHINLVNLLKM